MKGSDMIKDTIAVLVWLAPAILAALIEASATGGVTIETQL